MTALRWFLRLVLGLSVAVAWATPPNYRSFDRTQCPTPEVDCSSVAADGVAQNQMLRIWMIDVGQGDGLLIELPSALRYDPNTHDADTTRSEHIEILVDGGSDPASESDHTLTLLQQRRPLEQRIEYAVITHHDADHVRGLIQVLESDSYHVQTLFHNGLASYNPGTRDFPVDRRPSRAVVKFKSGRLKRGMAFVNQDGTLRDSHLIDTLAELGQARDAQQLHGVYGALADAVHANGVERFPRAFAGGAFINQVEAELDRGVDLSAIRFELLWPQRTLKKYKGWGETINGNSVTFRLDYGDFSMLFTGDHNELSEAAFIAHLEQTNALDKLNCDVLKVPHHGSHHALEAFYTHDDLNPVVSVASMGHKGFQSKALGRRNWQHPSTQVIQWLGGAHRVYHTHIHERRFLWPDLDTLAKHREMLERRHILIETDGRWFRIVEVDPTQTPLQIPSVAHTRRSNGTRWIEAR